MYGLKQISAAVDLPRWALEGWPRLTVMGRWEAELEGHGEILEFSEKALTVAWMKGRLTLEGEGLCIREMDKGALLIGGDIRTCRWEGYNGMES